jgi:hypothetical protein
MLRKIFGTRKINKIGFEDVVNFLNNKPKNTILINTLSSSEQNILIKNTTRYDNEESVINDTLKNGCSHKIIIYGKNCCDESMDNRYFQLINLGYIEEKLHIYYGGMLEWCLLQDVYDVVNFPTTNKCVDIIRFRESPKMSF